ncbi:MAG: membrane protein insertase YidC [Alphaproteobacteria bacterium]|nr:membrane protein insertase YidC [Alphaproteobacteria bacterium]
MNQQPQGDTRNLLIAVILSMAVFVVWFIVFPPLDKPKQEAKQQEAATATAPVTTPAGTAEFTHTTREAALAADARIPIATSSLDGSIRLKGARFDDLRLHNYRTEVRGDAPEVDLLEPVGVMNPYYGEFGWVADGSTPVELPGADTTWTLAAGDTLAPNKPVTLTWTNNQGFRFDRVISIDDGFMLTVEDRVTNNSGAPVKLSPYGAIVRGGVPYFHPIWVVHQGMIGVMNGTLHEVDYDEIVKDGERTQTNETTGGWLGFTDHYWMAALAPDQGEPVAATFRATNQGTWERYQSDFVYKNPREIAPGATTTVTHRMFAGAKIVSVVDKYAENPGIQRFDMAVDWGWFFFLTKPIFLLLDWLYGLVGNFGVAILLLTVILKALFFPIANKSMESMTKMKKIQPEMTAMRERFKEDPQRLQQEMLALYKREKVNPITGCLPMLLQIPVFFSLYKVLYVTIEMRHAPFFGWIQDLSAPDPTSLFNLFGLLPFVVPAFLHLGLLPFLNGIVMWVQMKLNPPAPDPAQQQIFAIMPWMFMFMLASFPAGLVVYWIWNGLLSITQQYVIMKRMKVEIHLFSNLRKSWPFKLFFRDAKA